MLLLRLFSLLMLLQQGVPCEAYEASWESLDSRPLPGWYPNAKIGIFIHWGVFSVPAFQTEWFWERWKGTHRRHGRYDPQTYQGFIDATENTKHFNYPDYSHRLDAALFDPNEWANVFAQSGAQYVVLTSKHHEGYCMFDSRKIPSTWNWNVMEVGPRRDLLGEFAQAIRQPNLLSMQTSRPLKLGIYHSLYEWFNPMYLQDQASNYTTQVFVDSKTMPELYHLVESYQPDLIWSDGPGQAHSDYWKSTQFLAWLATNSSVKDTVVWNDRWGIDAKCHHGSFWTCRDRYLPNTTSNHVFENAFTLDTTGSWGWNRMANVTDYMTIKDILVILVKTISRNGNVNINIGPAADGTISPIFVDRLLDMGKWLTVNGQGVYDTRPWKLCSQEEEEKNTEHTASHGDATVFYTRTDTILYAHVTKWPQRNRLVLSCPERTEQTTAYMLGLDTEHPNVRIVSSPLGESGMTIEFPLLTPDLVPCDHVWVIALAHVGNLNDGDDMNTSEEPLTTA